MSPSSRLVPHTLRQEDFFTLWIASLVSRIGDSIHEIALIWVVYASTESASLVSITVLASNLPGVIVSVPAGTLVDRVNRKSVMVLTNLVRGGVVLVIPAFQGSALLFPLIVSVAFVSGVMESIFKPAKKAILPRLVSKDDLESANSLLSMVRSFSNILYVVGGTVVGIFGSFTAFYIDAATFFISASILLAIPNDKGKPDLDTSEDKEDELGNFYGETREGIRYIISNPVLPSIILLWLLLGLSMGPLGVVLPIFADQVIKSGVFGFGILFASIYAGIFIGGYIINHLDDAIRENCGKVITYAAFVTGLLLAATAVLPQQTPYPLITAVGMLFISGLSTVSIWVPVQSLTQRIVPDNNRGKVFSVIGAVGSASLPLSVAVAGPLIEYTGVVTVFFVEGLLVVLSGAIISLSPLGDVTEEARATAISD